MILGVVTKSISKVLGAGGGDTRDLSNDDSVSGLLLALLYIAIVVVVNGLFGQQLWNTVAKKLVPALGKAEWYDTILLHMLLLMVLPACQCK
tara:strand:+ start:196 stop:471 length:276 start_codon:yes stop_codon:yes gene_type:complete